MEKMNRANQLTILRIILIVPFLLFLWLSYFGGSDITYILVVKATFRIIALAIFAIAVITDYYDGKIARETNTVTDFGKLMDPIADKLLTFTFLLVLLQAGVISLLLVLILLFREFFITAIRALVSNKTSKIIPASKYGKYKTIALYVGLFIIGLIPVFPYITYMLNSIILLPAVVLSIISAISYTKTAISLLEGENEEIEIEGE
ncbi:CDP-diacylglycerol--glycerol-3-phosphate 3-phosphatidyltransferase [Oceanivirga miroungae]|nr:CDP-diacylglycerol--glycerol-3-phosphate 3-phosphatidyltransferase [Oceanivirga miroungae]